MPLYKIGEKYGYSKSRISYWCKKWDIEVPGREYWINKRFLGDNDL